MEYRQELIDLLSFEDGINAIGIMTMGLAQVKDPYAGGFNVVWSYLVDAERKLREHIEHCIEIP